MGFPSHMNIDEVYNKFIQNPQFLYYASNSQKDFCGTLIRACNLKWTDLRFGNSNIFFRKGKCEIFTQNLEESLHLVIGRFKKLYQLRAKWRFLIMIARFCSNGKISVTRSLIPSTSHDCFQTLGQTQTSTQEIKELTIAKKRTKLNAQNKGIRIYSFFF